VSIIYIAVTLFYLTLLPTTSMATVFKCDADRANATAVVTPEKRIEAVSAFSTLFDTAVQQIAESDEYNNFILFVHGMGQHPCHAFDKSLIADMQKDYSAKVIMYHWPSWEGLIAFPEQNARQSATDFKQVLLDLKTYRDDHLALVKDIKLTLLTHSMGSLVLEELMLNQEGESFSNLFDTVVINAAASSAKNHAAWVAKMRMSDNIYITINQHDTTLGKAELHQEWHYGGYGWERLGKRLVDKEGNPVTLAMNANYIDVTAASLGHVYYLHRYLNETAPVKYFFNQVLNGIPPRLDAEHGVKNVAREQVYILEKDLDFSEIEEEMALNQIALSVPHPSHEHRWSLHNRFLLIAIGTTIVTVMVLAFLIIKRRKKRGF